MLLQKDSFPGMRVVVRQDSTNLSIYKGIKCTIVSIQLKDGKFSNYHYVVKPDGQNSTYQCLEGDLNIVSTTTLYAYEDKAGEVHWTTKPYTDAEAKRKKYKANPTYNKTFELE